MNPQKVTAVIAPANAKTVGARLWHGTADLAVSVAFISRDEGVLWARGWIDENSDEGRALITAYDLVHG